MTKKKDIRHNRDDDFRAPDTMTNLTEVTNTNNLLRMIRCDLTGSEIPDDIDLNEAFQLSMIAKLVIGEVNECRKK